jgi:hypothetical protein
MLEDILELVVGIAAIIIGAALFITAIGFPIAWFDGHAKSAYLKQTQGIDIPWYQATFLEVTITNNNVKIK